MRIPFFLVIISAVFLSGCSLLPGKKQKEIVEEPNAPSGFSTKIEKGSLFKTSDGGKTFEVKSQVNETTRIEKSDILSIAYHPTRQATLFVSTLDDGIFTTTNGGNTWEQKPFPPKRIYSFIIDRKDPDKRMFASGVLADSSKVFRTQDGGESWSEVYTEPGQNTLVTALAQHFQDMNVIFAGTSAGTMVKSLDSGDTWKNIGNKVDGAIADIVFDAKKPLVTYLLIADQKIYYSPDGGALWQDWEKVKAEEVKALQDAASRASQNKNQELAKRLRDQAAALAKRNQENKMPNSVVAITADPSVSGTLYAGTKSGLFRSTDFGKYWYEINVIESAKKFPIRSIAIDPKNSKEIVFVAGRAFYKSVNGGETWAVTSLRTDRDAAFISYDPFNSKYLFLGLRNFK